MEEEKSKPKSRKGVVALIVIALVVGGIYFFVKKIEQASRFLSQDEIEWTKCKNKELPPNFELVWKVEMKEISSFDGLFAKGYMSGDRSYPVHIVWNPESTTTPDLKPSIIETGDIIKLKGNCTGVTEKGEVIVNVLWEAIYE